MQSGRVLMHPALARQRFREIAEMPEQRIDLVEASLVIAIEDKPGLEIGHYLDEVDRMACRTTSQVVLHDSGVDKLRACPTRAAVEDVVESINRLLFEEEGFHGEDEDYYDPRSALLNELLDTHVGTPITLSILYLELTRRVGVDAAGISLPGRFLVKFTGDFGQIVVDPFDGGRILSTVELQQILDSVYGGGVRLREHHLRSLTRREIVARELAHLKSAYLAQHDLARAAASADRLLILDDRDAFELRDRAALAMQMHAYAVAIECLERYLALQPQAEDTLRIREQIAYLRAWIDQN